MHKYDKEAQFWVSETTEDHVAKQFEEIRPFWLVLSIIAVGVCLALLVVSGIDLSEGVVR